jgi:hypothetical protein
MRAWMLPRTAFGSIADPSLPEIGKYGWRIGEPPHGARGVRPCIVKPSYRRCDTGTLQLEIQHCHSIVEQNHVLDVDRALC